MTTALLVALWALTARPAGLVAALAVSLALPALGWAAARPVAGGHDPWGRAARAVGRVAAVPLALALLLRLADLASAALEGGPVGWFGGWVGSAPLVAAAAALAAAGGLPVPTVWLPGQAVAALALLSGLLVAAGAPAAAAARRGADPDDHAVPEGRLVALVLAAAAVLGFAVAFDALGSQGRPIPLLELLAALPVTAMALAVWALGRDPQGPVAVAEAAAAPAPAAAATLDVPALWRSVKALSSADRPFHTQRADAAARADGDGHRVSRAAWHDAGGRGAPPVALDELVHDTDRFDLARVLTDLPSPTEDVLVTAALLVAVREHGLHVLVVGRDPAARRDALLAAIQAGGAWPVGPLPAGLAALRDQLSRDALPTVTFLTPEELAGDGIRLLTQGGAAASFAASLGLVVLPGVDRGPSLAVTHRSLTLRRLSLALDRADARFGLLATGFAGRGTRRLVARAFPGHEVAEVPLRPRTLAEVRIWLADYRFVQGIGEGAEGGGRGPWALRAAKPVVDAGARVEVSDPTGTLASDDVAVWGGDVRLRRDVALGGAASLGLLDESWLVASFRAIGQRVATATATHDALWGLVDNPVTRFLVEGDHLAGLFEHGRLLPPEPCVGDGNVFLATAHLEAALRDGEQDVAVLRDLFHPSLVDRVVGASPEIVGHRLRTDADGTVRRAAVIARRPDSGGDPLRTTVTDRVLHIVDRDTGRVVGAVDALVAATRLYPRRVLALGGRRYEVPMHAHDLKRQRVEVEPVAATRPLTSPRLVSEPTLLEIVEALQDVAAGPLRFRIGSVDVRVKETVSGLRRASAGGDVVRYEPVSATYKTTARAVLFPAAATPQALRHLARSMEGVLRSHVLASPEDVDVVPLPAGWWPGEGGGFLVIDRYVGGMGLAGTLHEALVRSALTWTRTILRRCDCPNGCPRCSPPEILDPDEGGRPDKTGVITLLGG